MDRYPTGNQAHTDLRRQYQTGERSFEGAQLPGTNLLGADLGGVNLRGANLQDAILQGAGLAGANLRGADLQGANLQEANLRGVSLRGANLQGAHMQGANLQGADLRGADLQSAFLQDADLRGTWGQKTNLRNTNLEGATITHVRYNRFCYYHGLRIDSAVGDPLFKRFAQDQEYIEAFRSRSGLHYFLYILWLVFADCGRSVLPWALCSLLMALSFGWYFDQSRQDFKIADACPASDCSEGKRPPVICRCPSSWTYYYYSIVTFTTLGFGDVTPRTQKGEILVTLEVILGYLMLGGLISILSNKLGRRS